MASFAQYIENNYSTDTYQGTKNTYDWIEKVLQKQNVTDYDVEFYFGLADISCSCSGIEEFASYAYGQLGFTFYHLEFSIRSGEGSPWYISVDSRNEVRISTKSKILLEECVSLLKNTTLDDTEINDSMSITYIEQQHVGAMLTGNNNTIANEHSSLITGTGNTIANEHSAITPPNEPDESKMSQWLRAIGQNLLSNGIWYILCILGGVIIAQIIP